MRDDWVALNGKSAYAPEVLTQIADDNLKTLAAS